MRKKLMKTVASRGSTLDQLKNLKLIVADAIDAQPSAKDLPALVKQYRDLTAEVDEMEGTDTDDAIGEILSERRVDGKPGAVREDRSGL